VLGCARRALVLNRARRRARDKPGHDVDCVSMQTIPL
jgi:hypothetical protein